MKQQNSINTEMKTTQDVFDFVCTELKKQGSVCLKNERHDCYFRGDNDTKCLIGLLLPDEYVTDGNNSVPVGNLLSKSLLQYDKKIHSYLASLVKDDIEDEDTLITFYVDLQRTHDKVRRETKSKNKAYKLTKENLIEFASKWNLDDTKAREL